MKTNISRSGSDDAPRRGGETQRYHLVVTPTQRSSGSVPIFGLVLSLIITAAFLITCGQPPKPADMVILNGKIVTVDDYTPQAEALAVRGDIIVAVGSDRDIRPYIGDQTRVIDLDGKLAIPGFIEGHAHLMSLGQAKMRLDLSAAKSWDEIVVMVKDAVKKAQPDEWILGRGWHQEKWNKMPQPNVDGLPFHHALSKVSPDNPVLLTHASGHSAIANAKAMELARITKETPNPEGGEIVKGPDGNPIGVFREAAQEPLDKALINFLAQRTPEQVAADQRRAIDLAVRECLSKGITTFCDAGSSFETIDLFKELANEGGLGLRLWVMISESNQRLRQHLSRYKIVGKGDDRLTVRAIKRFMDGALGSHGAWLLEPYTDLPQSTGLNTTSLEVMKEAARLAMEHNFQLCTHAIGDRANRETLDIYEAAFKAYPHKNDLRWRVEHAQHLHPDDIPRFAQLGVIASMQGIHCTSDGPWVVKRLGEKRTEDGAYVWQKLMKSGAIIANGTDAPVEDVNPLANFYASVTRRLPDGTIFCPEQCMTREEALRSYTINCAFAAFEENIKGSITKGKLADITILDKDIMTVPSEEILNTKVLYTIVGGRIIYQQLRKRGQLE